MFGGGCSYGKGISHVITSAQREVQKLNVPSEANKQLLSFREYDGTYKLCLHIPIVVLV